MDSRPALLLAVVATVCVVAVAGAVAQSGYTITSPDSSPVPERTIDLQGESHTIDSRISVAPGSEITVEVSAPDELHRIYLYNSDRSIVDRHTGNGSGTYTFDTTGYDPGSYAVTTHSTESGQKEAVLPVLVEGYDVSVDAPASIDSDEAANVSVDVSATAASGDPASVSVVLANDDGRHIFDATGDGGQYTASIAAGDLDAGEYTVYGVVQGSEQAFGQNELLGLAEGSTLTVNQADGTDTSSGGGAPAEDGTATATPTNDTDAGTNGSSGETATATDTEASGATGGSGTTDETDTDETTPTADESDAADGTRTTEEPTTDDATPTDDSGAITPNDGGTAVGTTDADGPGFGPVHVALAIGAVLGLGALGRRRRRG